MSLSERDAGLTELMDDPACDPRRLAATYRRFALVNRLVSGWGTVWRTRLGPYLRSLDRPARVLDLGSGGGDLVARLAARARRESLEVTWTGADPDPRAHEAAAPLGDAHMRFVCADSTALLASGERYDAVVSNHVLHHLDAAALDGFLRDSRALSTGVVLHSDIARGRLPYALYAIGVTPLTAGTFLRTDGLRSIRRSYRPDELAAVLGPAWRVETPAPFRLLVRADGDA